jgi:hypothetical protein
MEKLLRILAFREVALMFLKSMNPKLDREIVIADSIMAYDGEIPDGNCRYLAHEFVREAERQINMGLPPNKTDVSDWINKWNSEFGIA